VEADISEGGTHICKLFVSGCGRNCNILIRCRRVTKLDVDDHDFVGKCFVY